MDLVFGTSSKGKQTVIYRNFEYSLWSRRNTCLFAVNRLLVTRMNCWYCN